MEKDLMDDLISRKGMIETLEDLLCLDGLSSSQQNIISVMIGKVRKAPVAYDLEKAITDLEHCPTRTIAVHKAVNIVKGSAKL